MSVSIFDLQATLTLDTQEFDQGLSDSASKASSFGDVLKGSLAAEAIGAGFSAIVNGAKTAVSALMDVGKSAVNSYKDYEQLTGGIETLFGSAYDQVMADAKNAYSTSGQSANEYMETVSMMAAALKQSTNTESEAAKAANNAVIDMADNASKMGSSMESIQNAYQGFSKQNYTMLDNLKLGYGGTKQEMERLLEDAEKLTGIHYDINQLDDVYAAIHAIQEDLGITGTTAEEAMHTIEGTANATKAAWENVLTAIAGGGDLSEAMDSLVTAVFGDGSDGSGLLANIIPRIQATLEGIADFIGQAAPMFAERIPGVIEQLLPPLLEAVGALVTGLASAIPGILEGLWNILLEAGTQLVNQLSTGWQGGIGTFISTIGSGMNTALTTVLAAIPQMLQAGIQIIQNVASGIANGLPNIVSAISNVITQLVSTISTYGPQILAKGVELITNLMSGMQQTTARVISAAGEIIAQLLDALLDGLPQMLDAGVQLIQNVANGTIQNIPAAASAAAQAVAKIIATIGEHLPEILEKGIEIIAKLAAGIIEGIPKAVATVPKIFSEIASAFKGQDWLSIGGNIIQGIGNGIRNGVGAIADAARSAAASALDAAKRFLGISSPSKRFRDEVGAMMMAGAGIGIEDNVPIAQVSTAIDRMMDAAKDGIEELDIPVGVSAEGNRGRLNGSQGGYGEITVNVYGSETMSVRELADAVMERIQTLTDRRVAVWA